MLHRSIHFRPARVLALLGLLSLGVISPVWAQANSSGEQLLKQATTTAKQKPQEAMPIYEQAFSAATDDDQRTRVLLAMSRVYSMQLKEPVKAREALERAVALTGEVKLENRATAIQWLGRWHADEKQFDKAIEYYNKVLPLLNDDAARRTETQMYLAQSLNLQRKVDEALALTKQIIDTPGADPNALAWSNNLQGEHARRAGKLEESRALYRKTLALENASQSHRNTAQLGLAEVDFSDKKYEESAKQFDDIANTAKVSPSNMSAAKIRAGDAWVELGKLSEGESRYNQVLQDENAPVTAKASAQLQLARLYARQKLTDKAREAYTKARDHAGANASMKTTIERELSKLGQ